MDGMQDGKQRERGMPELAHFLLYIQSEIPTFKVAFPTSINPS